jgi:hypothetical protein
MKIESEATLLHAQFYQILSRAIHTHPQYDLNPLSYHLYLELDQTLLPVKICHAS